MISVHTEFGTPVSYLSTDVIQTWSNTALADTVTDGEICIRIVDEAEMTELNDNFRQISKPTNVLSFPADISDSVDIKLLGDIAICSQVVEREAKQQSKELTAHWAHMVVHGCLHLIGMDHMSDLEAEEMESREIEILAALGFANPYAGDMQTESTSIADMA